MALADIVFSTHHACRKTHEEWLFALLRRNGGEVCILELGRKYITRTERKGVGRFGCFLRLHLDAWLRFCEDTGARGKEAFQWNSVQGNIY
jgi:hypothetical protein